MKTTLPRIKRIEHKAKESPREIYTSLFHHIYEEDMLISCFRRLKKDSTPGIDGISVADYATNLHSNLQDLKERLGQLSYIPRPARRTYIPKAGTRKKRPLGIPCTEDKIVQLAVKRVLEPIYEEMFSDCSYGYRPGRHAHDALAQIGQTIQCKKVKYVAEADIKGFFDHVNHDYLMMILEHRIQDKRLLRLIRRMLKAGIMEDGLMKASVGGTPQGSILSPLLSNIYLHYVLDWWFKSSFLPQCSGEAYLFRYADDYIACFQNKWDADNYMNQMKARLKKFHLETEPSKTQLLEFGRFAVSNAKERGQPKPKTFTFLGFTHYCGQTRQGKFMVKRRTSSKKFSSKLKEFNNWLKLNRSKRTKRQLFETSVRKFRGHLNYFAINDNTDRCASFSHAMLSMLFKWLNRKSQRRSYTWDSFNQAVKWYKWPPIRKKVNLCQFKGTVERT